MPPSTLPRRRRSASPFAALAVMLALRACGGTSIKQLLDDPGKYEGETVRVAGEVKGSIGVLGYGAYRIDDGTGTIAIVTQGRGAPRTGSKVGVEGVFRSAYTLGTESAAVILEVKRASP